MKILIKGIIVILLFLMLVTGCNTNVTQGDQDYMTLIKVTDPAPKNISSKKDEVTAEQIERDVEAWESIYDVAVIKGKDEDLVVYKVKHLQRFRMKKIEKEVTQKLESKYSNENFIVSSDYKIFLEASRLSKKMKDPNFSKEEAQRRLEEIIELQKELT